MSDLIKTNSGFTSFADLMAQAEAELAALDASLAKLAEPIDPDRTAMLTRPAHTTINSVSLLKAVKEKAE